MSTGGFQASISSPTTPVTPSNCLEDSSCDTDSVPVESIQSAHLEQQMLLKSESSPEQSVNSPGFVIVTPHGQVQSSSISQNIDADYNSNSFNFSYDGSFSLSPQQGMDMKDLEKGDSSSVVLSSRPLSNSSLSAGSNASPKSFMALSMNETKNDKMISGFDGRVDGLSPLSVIAVSAYQEASHPSPSIPSSILSRTHHVLRFHSGGDAMLSALNYNESDMLQEGGFEVPSSHAFNIDGFLGAGLGGSNAPGMRLPDLLDGEINHESYIEASQDLQLSPNTFAGSGDAFRVSDTPPLPVLNETARIKTEIKNKPITNASHVLTVDKLKVKGARPVKATSPSRPGTQPCPTCGKVFSNSSALTKHKLTHSDERKYVCQLCAKAFKRQDHLNGHMLTHRNKKPFECDAEGCGKSYCDARSLRRHKENHHSTASSSAPVSSLANQVSVIPGLAHLGFNSLQTSFPASVITNTSTSAFTETSLGNRIQYAPPPNTVTSTTTLSSRTPAVSSESASRTITTPVISSVIPTATSHLQFLTFHQQSSGKIQQPQLAATSVTKTTARSDGSTVLASWPSQTINSGALLLAQNYGGSQSIGQSQPPQLMDRSFETVSSTEQGNSSGSEMSQPSTLPVSKDTKKIGVILPMDTSEQNITQQQPGTKAQFEVVTSSSGAKQLVALTPQGSVNLQFETGTSAIVRLQDRSAESLYSHPAIQLVKIEPPDQSNNSLPTTPTSKDPSNCPQLESPLLQQLLKQQNSVEISSGGMNSNSEQQYISSLQAHQKQSASVLISQWSQVPYSIPNSAATNHRFSQDPKPVECSLCQRKFKNIPALNGHMRLHGGYFKKENDAKKNDRKTNGASNPPLQTASTNIRALIEEKIIQKRNFMPQPSIQSIVDAPSVRQTFNLQSNQLSTQQQNSDFVTHDSPILSPITQEAPVFTDFPVTSQPPDDLESLTSHNFDLDADTDILFRKLDFKQQFRVPRPPLEKHRRHSDSDHFILPKRPCTTFTNSALADLLRRKVVAKRSCRTGSDPGEPLILDAASLADIANSLAASVIHLPKFTSIVPASLNSAIDDATSELQQQALTEMTSEETALPVLSAEDIPEAQPMIVGMREMSEIDTNCLDRSVFFESSNNDLSVGQPFPEISVSELEIMQFASAVTTTSVITNDVKPINGNDKGRTGEDSNDDDVFLSPTSLPTSPMKIKKKRRPEPLYIPPYVNTCGYSSRLRSPRLWDPSNPECKKLSPPPYTPPPMLSPVRSGSGLFWHIISGSGSLTPKSAPITPSFGLARKVSTGESTPEAEEESVEAPETDVLPHVNVGSYYQAKIPPFNPNFKDALLVEHKADKVWDPAAMEQLSEEEIDMYLEFSCCAAIPGGGTNKEYAHHLLQICKGCIQDAILSLLDSGPKLPPNHPLLTYQYSENDQWNPDEIEAYHQGLLRSDKDFFNISKEITTKSVKQCIQFYYLWKKVCPDEYKRLRLIRRRKEQESLYYNLRSKEALEENDEKNQKNLSPTSSIPNNVPEDVFEQSTTVNGSEGGSNSTVTNYNGSSISGAPSPYSFTLDSLEEFPCKLCGKVFNKVKSRSAHMKSHRQPEIDKRSKYD